MNIFIKQFQKNVVLTVLLIMVLAAGISFCSIGSASWFRVKEQVQEMDNQYTTIAVPVGSINSDYNEILYAEGMRTFLTEQKEHDYPGLLAEDIRGFLVAHVPGCESVSPYGRGEFSFDNWFDAYNNSMMVLAVRCTFVEEFELEYPNVKYLYDEKGEFVGQEEMFQKYYGAEFTLEDVVCRLSAYDTIPEDILICVRSYLHTEEGKIPFEEGKTYLLFGIDRGIATRIGGEVLEEVNGEEVWVSDEVLEESMGIDAIYGTGTLGDYNWLEGNLFFSWQEKKDSSGNKYDTYFTLTEDSLPFYAEYEGDWREFLDSDDGKIWREEIIPWCRLNHESASVILTDNIDSMLLFNNGTADILEGRKFQRREYEDGKDVCMVSAAYAEKNGLSEGDVIHLDLYQSDLNYQTVLKSNGRAVSESWRETVWVQDPCMPEKRIGVQKDYTIVGIYTAPEFSAGWHNFQADTIFIPKASVPDADRYDQEREILMYSAILKNGMEEEFEAYVAEMGYGGLFIYSDQGYHEAKKSFQVLAANTMRLTLAGFAVFVLTGVLFLFLSFRRAAPTIRSMRLLGVSGKIVWRDLTAALAIVIVVSAAFGAGLGYLLYGIVTARTLEQSIAIQPQVMILCAAVQAAVLLAAAAVAAKIRTDRALMGKRKKIRDKK